VNPATTPDDLREQMSRNAVSYGAALRSTCEAAIDLYESTLNRLAELHAIAAAHNPRPPSPEQAAEFRRRREETLARIGPDKAWQNIQRALQHREFMGEEEHSQNVALWDAWDDARDPHDKAKLQMRLGESVASWMSHADAQEREIARLRRLYAACAQCGAELQAPATPPHCLDCVVDEAHGQDWAEAQSR
jgi:hypothetical protein